MTYGEGGLAVLALEAGPVEDGAISGELVHGVHRLGAHLALLLRPAEHPVSSESSPSSRDLRVRSDLDLRAENEHLCRGSRWPPRTYIRKRRDAIKQ